MLYVLSPNTKENNLVIKCSYFFLSPSPRDPAVLSPKWFSHGRIILAKYQPCHSYTFWTMTIMIFSSVYFFSGHTLGTCLIMFYKIWILTKIMVWKQCYSRKEFLTFLENYKQIDLVKNLKEMNEFTERSFIHTTPLLVGFHLPIL